MEHQHPIIQPRSPANSHRSGSGAWDLEVWEHPPPSFKFKDLELDVLDLSIKINLASS